MESVFVLGMTGGEAFVVGFLTVAIVSAPWWPRVGARLFGGGAPPSGNR